MALTDKQTRAEDHYPMRLHSSYCSNTFSIIQVYLCDFISLTSFNIRNTLLFRKTLVPVVLSQKRGYIPSDKVPLNLCGNEQTAISILHSYCVPISGKKDQPHWWELLRISPWFIHLNFSLCLYDKDKVA